MPHEAGMVLCAILLAVVQLGSCHVVRRNEFDGRQQAVVDVGTDGTLTSFQFSESENADEDMWPLNVEEAGEDGLVETEMWPFSYFFSDGRDSRDPCEKLDEWFTNWREYWRLELLQSADHNGFKQKKVDELNSILKDVTDVNDCQERQKGRKMNYLHEVAAKDEVEFVSALLNKSASLTSVDGWGKKALQLAAETNPYDGVLLLLHEASEEGDYEVEAAKFAKFVAPGHKVTGLALYKQALQLGLNISSFTALVEEMERAVMADSAFKDNPVKNVSFFRLASGGTRARVLMMMILHTDGTTSERVWKLETREDTSSVELQMAKDIENEHNPTLRNDEVLETFKKSYIAKLHDFALLDENHRRHSFKEATDVRALTQMTESEAKSAVYTAWITMEYIRGKPLHDCVEDMAFTGPDAEGISLKGLHSAIHGLLFGKTGLVHSWDLAVDKTRTGDLTVAYIGKVKKRLRKNFEEATKYDMDMTYILDSQVYDQSDSEEFNHRMVEHIFLKAGIAAKAAKEKAAEWIRQQEMIEPMTIQATWQRRKAFIFRMITWIAGGFSVFFGRNTVFAIKDIKANMRAVAEVTGRRTEVHAMLERIQDEATHAEALAKAALYEREDAERALLREMQKNVDYLRNGKESGEVKLKDLPMLMAFGFESQAMSFLRNVENLPDPRKEVDRLNGQMQIAGAAADEKDDKWRYKLHEQKLITADQEALEIRYKEIEGELKREVFRLVGALSATALAAVYSHYANVTKASEKMKEKASEKMKEKASEKVQKAELMTRQADALEKAIEGYAQILDSNTDVPAVLVVESSWLSRFYDDIAPQNILVDVETNTVKCIDPGDVKAFGLMEALAKSPLSPYGHLVDRAVLQVLTSMNNTILQSSSWLHIFGPENIAPINEFYRGMLLDINEQEFNQLVEHEGPLVLHKMIFRVGTQMVQKTFRPKQAERAPAWQFAGQKVAARNAVEIAAHFFGMCIKMADYARANEREFPNTVGSLKPNPTKIKSTFSMLNETKTLLDMFYFPIPDYDPTIAS